MRKVFMCSLCHNGILGGGLYLDNQAVTYRTCNTEIKNFFIFLQWISDKLWSVPGKRVIEGDDVMGPEDLARIADYTPLEHLKGWQTI